MAVLLQGTKGTFRRVDRKIREIRSTQAFELGIEIGEIAALKQGVVAEVYTWHDVTGAEGGLLGLGEEIIDATIKHHATYLANRQLFLPG